MGRGGQEQHHGTPEHPWNSRMSGTIFYIFHKCEIKIRVRGSARSPIQDAGMHQEILGQREKSVRKST